MTVRFDVLILVNIDADLVYSCLYHRIRESWLTCTLSDVVSNIDKIGFMGYCIICLMSKHLLAFALGPLDLTFRSAEVWRRPASMGCP